jgi:hypothetical protein
MGYWGYDWFQGDRDFDVASDLSCQMEIEDKFGIFQPENPEAVRKALDSGKLEAAFKKHRDAEKTQFDPYYGSEVHILVLGAAAMELGATISDEHRAYMRVALEKDLVIHKAAKESMKTALDKYENGTPYALAGKGLVETANEKPPRTESNGLPYVGLNVPPPGCQPQ